MEKLERDGIYTSAQVARLLFGHDVEWFYRYRNGEGRNEGFPKPISSHGQPRWSGAVLIAWRDRPGRDAPLLILPDASGTVVDIRERLRARSQAMAAKRLSR